MSTRRRKRRTPEQVVRKLQEADRLLAEGADGPEVALQLGISEQTYYRWRNQFRGLKAHDVKRLRQLERENATLKRLLAEAELEKAALKEIATTTLAAGTDHNSCGDISARTNRLPSCCAASRCSH